MNWQLHHAMIPAFDMQRTQGFFADVLGMAPVHVPPTNDPINPAGPEYLLLYVDDDGRELHVVKPVPNFSQRNGVPINPTMGHVAFTVDDLDAAKRQLDRGGWTYGDTGAIGPGGMKRIYVHDPHMNVIELNQRPV